ncbi:AlbA family DNA-binding domain-containing protein [Pedobacter ginsengisoli]|uniref:AlbA family DNA-binding domain-containing protein n=1 Tax=Pedobacter ginsengisoli TaxID=363852 RepID=UPI00254E67CC|nr:ATP-binding protein [Pedobacter ginsengisoli]
MTSQEFKDAILIKSPRFALSHEPLFKALANKGDSKGQFSQFGPQYELYIYAFFIGLHVNSRVELPPRTQTTDFVKMNMWKRGNIINYLLFVVFSNSDEIGFEWDELEQMSEKQLDEVIKKIITFIEEYANGGLIYLKNKYDQDELSNSQYLFIDLLDDIVEEFDLMPKMDEEIEEIETVSIDVGAKSQIDVMNFISKGETSNIEFKSTLRINLNTGNPDRKMEHSCMKTLAAFANSSGGILFIGVDDEKEILGLEVDLKSFGNKKDLMDEFQKHLDNLIEQYFTNAFFSLVQISFPLISERTICMLEVKRSSKQIILSNKADGNKQEFYIRRSASTKALEASEMIEYIRANWR